VFDAGATEGAIERFSLSEEGYVGAERLLRRLVRQKRGRARRIVLVRAVVVGISVWVISSAVFGAFLTRFGLAGWSEHVATASLSISEVSNAIWRGALVVLAMMWLVDARTVPDRRGLRVGLASVGVAGLVLWVGSVCSFAVQMMPLGGISRTLADVFPISAYVVGASRAVWTSALAGLVLMWLIRSTESAPGVPGATRTR
jgi:hypothetical protein